LCIGIEDAAVIAVIAIVGIRVRIIGRVSMHRGGTTIAAGLANSASPQTGVIPPKRLYPP
jgi:hypothetical protein